MNITAGGQVTIGGDVTEGDKTTQYAQQLTTEEQALLQELLNAKQNPDTKPEKIGEILSRIAAAGFPALTQVVVALLKK